jgi:hypothetical protein
MPYHPFHFARKKEKEKNCKSCLPSNSPPSHISFPPPSLIKTRMRNVEVEVEQENANLKLKTSEERGKKSRRIRKKRQSCYFLT